MRPVALGLVTICFALPACSDPQESENGVVLDNVRIPSSQEIVSGFENPTWQGAAVRDHSGGGVEIVTPPARSWHKAGDVFDAVNNVPVVNADHFREMMNAHWRAGREVSLHYWTPPMPDGLEHPTLPSR